VYKFVSFNKLLGTPVAVPIRLSLTGAPSNTAASGKAFLTVSMLFSMNEVTLSNSACVKLDDPSNFLTGISISLASVCFAQLGSVLNVNWSGVSSGSFSATISSSSF
jgi:hypothetical protein